MKITLELDADQAALLCRTLERSAKQYFNSDTQQQLFRAVETAIDEAEREAGADLTIQVRGLDFNTIEFIHGAEKVLDQALLPLGFTRQGSSKGGERVKLLYRQFATALI
jgi:hypothetical protein